VPIDHILDRLELGCTDDFEMVEIETEAVRFDKRSGLLDMVAEDLPKGCVQKVGRRVVPPRRIAFTVGHLSCAFIPQAHRSFRQTAPVDGEIREWFHRIKDLC
jgi:hypothetical protein